MTYSMEEPLCDFCNIFEANIPLSDCIIGLPEEDVYFCSDECLYLYTSDKAYPVDEEKEEKQEEPLVISVSDILGLASKDKPVPAPIVIPQNRYHEISNGGNDVYQIGEKDTMIANILSLAPPELTSDQEWRDGLYAMGMKSLREEYVYILEEYYANDEDESYSDDEIEISIGIPVAKNTDDNA